MVRLLKLMINLFLIATTILLVMGCDSVLVGRKTLSWSPSTSIVKSKEIGAYVTSYSWTYTPYVNCQIDTIINISEVFLEKRHRWYSYKSDSVVNIDGCYDFIVRCESHKNIIFPNFIYGDWYEDKCMLQYDFRKPEKLRDTISTYVIWAPESHFDEFGRYEFSLREGFYDFNDVEAYKKYKHADGAVVLGLLQFIRDKD